MSDPAPQVSTRRHAMPLGLRITRKTLRALALVSSDLAARAAFRLWHRPTRSPVSQKAEAVLGEGRLCWISSGTRRVACWEWADGPGVLLLHGWNSRAAHLTHYVRPLVASGFRVVAIDAPGHGQSPGRRIDVHRIVESLQEIDREFGPFRGAVVHSFGAIPLAMALTEEKFSVERAVCLAPATQRDSLLSAFGSQLALPDVVLSKVARRVEAFTGPDFWDRIFIGVPTFLVHDAEDDQIPLSDTERIEQTWPRARLLVTHGLGHRGVLSQPSVIGEAVAFLTEDHSNRLVT